MPAARHTGGPARAASTAPQASDSPGRTAPRRPARRGLLGLALAGLLAAALPAAAQLGRVEKADFEAALDATAYAPGGAAHLAGVMTIESGWHTNSHRPTFDYLIPTELAVELPDGWGEASVVYPPGEMATFSFEDQPLSVYEGEVTLVASFAVPAGAAAGGHLVEAALTYQACDDRSCLPPVTVRRALDLSVGEAGRPTPAADRILAALDAASGEGGGAAEGGRPVAAAGAALGLPLTLFLALVGGLILNAMPCVLPVLSLKVFGLVKSAGKGRAQVVVGALATSAGILFSFWALAVAAIVARRAGAAVGWGVQFQEPGFVAALGVLVVLFCLNLWGVFEIPLPARLARLADSGPKEGVPGHLASGLFATLMATPCSAPFLGTAVGFALGRPAGVVLAVFTAIGVGMALPYLALAAAPGAARLLPKPGAWMDRLKVFMGFLLAAAAIWLFYVLAAQVSPERVAFIQLALLAMALFVWMRHVAAARPWRGTALAGILASIVLTVGLAAGAEARPTGANAEASYLIPWVVFDRQEAEQRAAEGELVFVDVTADWCFTCKVNERVVLETPEVAAAFERHGVVPMKADWTNRDDAIAQFLADHGRYGIPFYLLYRPGEAPHLFPELLTRDGLLEVVEQAAARLPARTARVE